VKREILMINHIEALRFLTFVRNDIFPYYDTVSLCERGTYKKMMIGRRYNIILNIQITRRISRNATV